MDSPPHPPARVCTTTLSRVLSKAFKLRRQPGGVNNELFCSNLKIRRVKVEVVLPRQAVQDWACRMSAQHCVSTYPESS